MLFIIKFLAIKAAPIVGSNFELKLLFTNLYSILDFPTPESPSKTILTSKLLIILL